MAIEEEFRHLSELEAAVLLYAATVVADGEAHTKEIDELVQQTKLIAQNLGNSTVELEANLSKIPWILPTKEGKALFNLEAQQVRYVASLIESDDLKIQVMNAIFEIAYSDDHYHHSEREIVTILRECWGV